MSYSEAQYQPHQKVSALVQKEYLRRKQQENWNHWRSWRWGRGLCYGNRWRWRFHGYRWRVDCSTFSEIYAFHSFLCSLWFYIYVLFLSILLNKKVYFSLTKTFLQAFLTKSTHIFGSLYLIEINDMHVLSKWVSTTAVRAVTCKRKKKSNLHKRGLNIARHENPFCNIFIHVFSAVHTFCANNSS